MTAVAEKMQAPMPVVESLEESGFRRAQEDAIIAQARAILRSRVCSGSLMKSPDVVRNYLRTSLGGLEHERFDVLLLNGRNRLIAHLELFNGTIMHTTVYPREILQLALRAGAVSIIAAVNQLNDAGEPSEGHALTARAVRDALALVDIRLLDFFIVARDQVFSFAEHGRL